MLLDVNDYGDVIITPTSTGYVIHNMAGIQMSDEQTNSILANDANEVKPSLCITVGDIIQTDKGLAMVVGGEYAYGVYEVRVVRLSRSRKTFIVRWVNQDVPFVRPTFDHEKMRSGLLLDRIRFALQLLPFGLPTKKLKLANRLGERFLRESILAIGNNRDHMLAALHAFISVNLTSADRCAIEGGRVYFMTHGNRFFTDGLDIYADTSPIYSPNHWTNTAKIDSEPSMLLPRESPLFMLTQAIMGNLYSPCIGLKSIIEAATKDKGI